MATTNPYGYATDVFVQSALPVEMDYKLPASLPAAKNFEIRCQPVNSQSFSAGSVIQIDIPCGRKNQFLDPTTTYIRFKATYAVTGGTNGTDYSRLIGSAYSYFLKQEVYGNNSVLLESINEIGVLASMLINSTMTAGEKAGLSSSFGFDSNFSVLPAITNAQITTANAANNAVVAYGGIESVAPVSATVGHLIYFDTVLQNLVFEYSIPIIGILGSGTDKMIPIGDFYGLRYELTLDSIAHFTVLVGGTHPITGLTITEFEFVANVIELSPEAGALVDMANPEKIHIRSCTYRQASNNIAAANGGTNDLLVGIRVSSLKSIFCVPTPTTTAPAEGKFGGVNPMLDQGTCYIIGGQNYPQRTISPGNHPSDTFMELQKSFGALAFNHFNGCITKSAYNVADASYLTMTQAYNSTVANCVTRPNQFYIGIDTEVVARKASLLSGINVNSSPMFFRAQLNTAVTNAYTFNFWGYYDVILEIDKPLKNIIAKF